MYLYVCSFYKERVWESIITLAGIACTYIYTVSIYNMQISILIFSHFFIVFNISYSKGATEKTNVRVCDTAIPASDLMNCR